MKQISSGAARVKALKYASYFEEYGKRVEDAPLFEDEERLNWYAAHGNVIPFRKPQPALNGAAVAMTFFPNQYAKSMRVERLTLQQLAERVTTTTAKEKTKLPYVKLASFNGAVNPANPKKGCLR